MKNALVGLLIGAALLPLGLGFYFFGFDLTMYAILMFFGIGK